MEADSRTRWSSVAEYVGSLGLDAYLVGGAVRDELLGRGSKDEDFVVPGVDYDELEGRLAPHGRVEPLEVAGRRVGARLHPRDRDARALAPAGIEFAPPRVERSTGPGRHDFEIVADRSLAVADDMARRDFTVNAIAKRLRTGELVDPFDGAADLQSGVLRTVGPRSFAEDPLRIVRGLRLVSELGLEPDEGTRAQMAEHARAIAHVSGERIGGGVEADGLGELSRLLLGRWPARALRLARDTGVLVALIPEYERVVGYEQESRYHALPLDEHHFEAVQAAADAGAPLDVRLALLLHDAGKPEAAWRGDDGRLHFYANPRLGTRGHEEVGAEIAARVLRRLRYPTRLRDRVRRIVRYHMFFPPRHDDPVKARRFLQRHGAELARALLEHKRADLLGKGREATVDIGSLERFRASVERELAAPHRLRDLAVDGGDLIELGFRPGPALGQALEQLLADVVDEPELNHREALLERARELLP